MIRAARHVATTAGAAVAVAALIGGCTRHLDDAQPRSAPLAAPITTGQAVDLLSPKVQGEDGNLFVTAEPRECSGLAQEVDPPFLDAHGPLTTDGGHWTPDGPTYVEEMVAVYRYDFDAAKALDDVRRTLESCGGRTLTVTTMQGRTYVFDVAPVPQGPQGIVVWALRAVDWKCDNAFVAAHNAAIEITTCGDAGGYDVTALALDAQKRIEALANTAA